jgi:hypothetical protein
MKLVQMFILVFLLSVGVSLLVAESVPEFTQPGWFIVSQRPDSLQKIHVQNMKLTSTKLTSNVGLLSQQGGDRAIAEVITPEIETLARALENDPKKIFDYVHDNIRHVLYFGSKKGAQLTLLERSGNDFDQCALLVALLRAAGFTNVNYQFGFMQVPFESANHMDLRSWFGLAFSNTNYSNTVAYLNKLLCGRSGYPTLVMGFPDSNSIAFHRVWVKLKINGTDYYLDPAFKVHEPVVGIDLTNAMNFSSNALWSAVGGTATADYVLGLSQPNLGDKLQQYTANLFNFIQSNHPNKTVEQILGGFKVVSSITQSLPLSVTFPIYIHGGASPVVDWTYIPTNLMTTFQIKVSTTNRLLYMPELQGRKLALTFNSNGLAQLWLEDDLLLEKQTSGDSRIDVVFYIDHPHGVWDWTNNILINTDCDDHAVTNIYQRTNASYAICYAFEPHRDLLKWHQRKLDEYRASGLADDSRQVLTETLNIMGLSWMLQTEQIGHLLAAQQQLLLKYHHRLGRMAMEAGNGYYIDVYMQLEYIHPANGMSDSDLSRYLRAFDLEQYFFSAMEHGVIEQI